jgi:hypothetical protein
MMSTSSVMSGRCWASDGAAAAKRSANKTDANARIEVERRMLITDFGGARSDFEAVSQRLSIRREPSGL